MQTSAARGTTETDFFSLFTQPKHIPSLAPQQYHYRPGTLSGWLASALNKYSKRRRRERER